ncbi:hypothetical protein HBI76_121240 [Parastagonospora nodorum]|nr:hypothetical protein HBI76_121240 [Parastagonospora nodorum]
MIIAPVTLLAERSQCWHVGTHISLPPSSDELAVGKHCVQNRCNPSLDSYASVSDMVQHPSCWNRVNIRSYDTRRTPFDKSFFAFHHLTDVRRFFLPAHTLTRSMQDRPTRHLLLSAAFRASLTSQEKHR